MRLGRAATSAFLLLLLAPAGFAQAGQTARDNAKRQAEESAKAFLGGDYARLADFTYPKLVELLGGRDGFAAFVEKQMREMKEDDFEVVSFSVGDPSEPERLGEELFTFVPVVLKARAPRLLLSQESYMIGVSGDGGLKWTFVSGSSATEQTLKLLSLRPPAG